MKSHMTERRATLSCLLDGEDDGETGARALAAAAREQELQDAWRMYVLIGDTLRGEPVTAQDTRAAVMASLRDEPVVLAPRRPVTRERPHPFLALAASIAGVAVVGWLSFVDVAPDARSGGLVAAVSPGPTFIGAQLARDGQAAPQPVVMPVHGEMNEYLFAHHMQASAMRLGDSTERVRTISQVVGSARP